MVTSKTGSPQITDFRLIHACMLRNSKQEWFSTVTKMDLATTVHTLEVARVCVLGATQKKKRTLRMRLTCHIIMQNKTTGAKTHF